MKLLVNDETGTPIEVDPLGAKNLMEAIRDAGLNIAAQCGGGASCGTCHVYLDKAWSTKLKPTTDAELAMLEFVEERKENSRLSCQISLSDDLDGLSVTLAPGTSF